MSLDNEGLSLFDAARAMGVTFSKEVRPHDRSVSTTALKLHYLDWGTEGKQHMLFLHGALQQGHSWDFVALPLCPDYHVLALDSRGHGDSDWAPEGDYSPEAYQADLDGFVDALGLDQFILVGHSMGGRNAYIYASRHPEKVKSLVIVDTGPRISSSGESRIRSFRELPDDLDTYQEFATRVQEYTGRTREQVLGALKYTIKQRSDGKWTWKYDRLLRSPGFQMGTWPPERLWESVSGIRCPTLIVRGSDSDIFESEVMERMLEVIPGSTSAVVARAGHLVAGDNPVGFLEALQTLLDRA